MEIIALHIPWKSFELRGEVIYDSVSILHVLPLSPAFTMVTLQSKLEVIYQRTCEVP